MFRVDPEVIHKRFVRVGQGLGRRKVTRALTRAAFGYEECILSQTIAGVKFPNPVGLAAGFDKNAELLSIMPAVGFGFMEVGSITVQPYQGNPPPRLRRLKKSRGLVVNYGLKSAGAKALARRIGDISQTNERLAKHIPLGISIARSNVPGTEVEEAGILDQVECYEVLRGLGDYVTLNLSCPNTAGGEPFHKPELLNSLLRRLPLAGDPRPTFLKISPNLSPEVVSDIIEVALKHNVTGLVIGNLAKNKDNARLYEDVSAFTGGISGKPTELLANKLIAHAYQQGQGKLVIIGCGGVFSAEDAYAKIKLGASLVQLITGMIYEGPQLISSINIGLARLLKKDSFTNIKDAVGAGLLTK